jgi:hypothetical protein
LLGILEQEVQRFALYAGHGLHILGFIVAFKYENRVDEVRWSEYVLSHQVS